MSSNFPSSDDNFTEPSSPGSTALSSSGTGSRNHTQHHRDLGDAIEAMQAEATLLAHSHNGSTARHGSKLAQANTHQSPDTDSATSALHHTLGTGANQSAAGNHTHTQSTSHNSPDTDSATSSLHHTIGTGANQAAAGNHVHAHPISLVINTGASPYTFTKATYPGLYAIVVELYAGGGGSASTPGTDGTHWAIGLGGAGGGYARALILATDLLSSETITVGLGGAGAIAGGADGVSGGDSSFGVHFTVLGGEAGTTFTALTNSSGSGRGQKSGGGWSGTFDFAVAGCDTGVVNYGSGPKMFCTDGLSGAPGGGPLGQKCQEQRGGDINGIGTMGSLPGLGYASGARGCVSLTSDFARPGAAGSPGICIIQLIY